MSVNACLGCKWAEWKQTAAGRLHPDQSGRCTWSVELKLPASMGHYNAQTITHSLRHHRFIYRNSSMPECEAREGR